MTQGLNAGQAAAVETLSGPLLVLAGAGTGKTRVVTVRITRLIAAGIRPERILAVTFTNKAAAEMRQRLKKLLPRVKPGPTVSTFHSLGLNVLRRHAARLGWPAEFALFDRSDQESLAREILRTLKLAETTLKPGDLLFAISRSKSAGLTPEQAIAAATTDKDHLAASAYRRYQVAMRQRGAFDFDDLIIKTEELLRTFPEVRAAEAGRFDHLLIDEYQDTNASQYRLVRHLADGHKNLCVVGDDDQSIYGWRGAEVEHILRFSRDWPGCRVVRLEENYRSTGAILTLANRLIAFNTVRHDKVLRPSRGEGKPPAIEQCDDETAEAKTVVRSIKRHLDKEEYEPSAIAILFRTGEQTRLFETELRAQAVPYVVVGGMSFFDRKEVRDVLSYLRLIVRPEDETALRRIINTPPRGLGTKAVDALLEVATKAGAPLWQVLTEIGQQAALRDAAAGGGRASRPANPPAPPPGRALAGLTIDADEEPADTVATGRPEPTLSAAPGPRFDVPDLPLTAIRGVQALLRAIAKARAGLDAGEPAAAVATGLLADVNYRAEIDRVFPEELDRQARWTIVEDVVNSLAEQERDKAAAGKRMDLTSFLDDLTLRAQDIENDRAKKPGAGGVTLMTLHAAKGLEFPVVYLVGLEEGLLPHRRSIEEEGRAIDEERRLCYVGVTRAQEELTLTFPLTRMKWGKARPTLPSRFLYEMLGNADRATDVARKSRSHGRSEFAGPRKKKPT